MAPHACFADHDYDHVLPPFDFIIPARKEARIA